MRCCAGIREGTQLLSLCFLGQPGTILSLRDTVIIRCGVNIDEELVGLMATADYFPEGQGLKGVMALVFGGQASLGLFFYYLLSSMPCDATVNRSVASDPQVAGCVPIF